MHPEPEQPATIGHVYVYTSNSNSLGQYAGRALGAVPECMATKVWCTVTGRPERWRMVTNSLMEASPWLFQVPNWIIRRAGNNSSVNSPTTVFFAITSSTSAKRGNSDI